MKISYQQVEDACNTIHMLANNMKTLLENVQNCGNRITSSESWKGPASDYYIEKIKKLSNNFERVYCEMENSVLFMASCSEGYQAMDQTVVSEICNNLNILGPNLSTSILFKEM